MRKVMPISRKVERSNPKAILGGIVALLREKPRYLTEIERELSISRNWLSGFMTALEALDIVERKGTCTFKLYKLR